jgi:hypothetical protein
MVKFAQVLLVAALFAGASTDNQIYASRDDLSWGWITARCFLPFKVLRKPVLLDCLNLRGGSSGEELDVSSDEREFDSQDENGCVGNIFMSYFFSKFY